MSSASVINFQDEKKQAAPFESPVFTGKLFKVKNQFFFFNTAVGQISKISKNTAQVLENKFSNNRGGCDIPSSTNLLTSIVNPYSTTTIKKNLKRNLRLLILELTPTCNMRCNYCVDRDAYKEKKDTIGSKAMSQETALAAVDYLLEHSQDQKYPLAISFYGGEPLLRFPILKSVVKYVSKKALHKPIYFTITTNAILLSDEYIKFLIKHNFLLVISLDGPKAINDKHRVIKINNGSAFDKIVDALSKIKKIDESFYNNNVTVSSVIMPGADLIELKNFFNNLGVKLTGNYVESYNINHDKVPNEANSGSFNLLKQEVTRKLKERGTSYLIDESNNDFGLAVFRQILSRFKKLEHSATSTALGQCILGASRLYVSAEGSLYPCEKLANSSYSIIGNIKQGLSHKKVTQLNDEFYKITKNHCSGCWMSNQCPICLNSITHGNKIDLQKLTHYCQSAREWGSISLEMLAEAEFN